jgi:putative polyhydroxyalkanoate system protein
MPDIHLQRAHHLGLTEARRLAQQWTDDAEQRFGLTCEVARGEDSDTVRFSRSGVNGELTVTAESFEVNAKLGFLLASFAPTIEAKMAEKLDALLGTPPAAA